MRILFLTHAFNCLTQRLFNELSHDGHEVSVEFDINDSVTEEAVALWRPELIVAPFLKRRIPDAVWQRHRCIVIHPHRLLQRGDAQARVARRVEATALQQHALTAHQLEKETSIGVAVLFEHRRRGLLRGRIGRHRHA